MTFRQRVLEMADKFYRKASLATDEVLAAEYRKAGRLLLDAIDGAGELSPLYRLGCFLHGETVFVRGEAFHLQDGIWTTGTTYPRGRHKGELIVKLDHEKFLTFLSMNGYVPRVSQ